MGQDSARALSQHALTMGQDRVSARAESAFADSASACGYNSVGSESPRLPLAPPDLVIDVTYFGKSSVSMMGKLDHVWAVSLKNKQNNQHTGVLKK